MLCHSLEQDNIPILNEKVKLILNETCGLLPNKEHEKELKANMK